jgi:hypothetical protein
MRARAATGSVGQLRLKVRQVACDPADLVAAVGEGHFGVVVTPFEGRDFFGENRNGLRDEGANKPSGAKKQHHKQQGGYGKVGEQTGPGGGTAECRGPDDGNGADGGGRVRARETGNGPQEAIARHLYFAGTHRRLRQGL